MKKHIETRVNTEGGAGVACSVTLISAGILILLDVSSRIVWGSLMIVCGVSFFLGMIWLGSNAGEARIVRATPRSLPD